MMQDLRPQAATLKQQKDAIRTAARQQRAAITGQERRTAADALAANLAQLPLTPDMTVGCYLPIGTELQTLPLLQALHRGGYKIALPRTVGAERPLQFLGWQPGAPLTTDRLGFPAPVTTDADHQELHPDLLLVPLTAFDRSGNRLGQGAGFYDMTLARLRRQNPAIRAIGIAFACQEYPALPADTHDQRLDGILTERGYIAVGQ